MDAREKDSRRWLEDMWCLLLTFPKLVWLVVANVPYQDLMQMVTMVLARVGGFNQCASPNTIINLYTVVSFSVNICTIIYEISLFS